MSQVINEYAKFEDWLYKLPLQTLTDELKDDINERVAQLIDM